MTAPLQCWQQWVCSSALGVANRAGSALEATPALHYRCLCDFFSNVGLPSRASHSSLPSRPVSS